MADLARFARVLSSVLGWIYTLSWSASFYPQPVLNWKKKSTDGISVDFPFLNVVGFASYTTSTACLLYSPVIRSQYASRHPEAPIPTVRFNDLAYAIHALIMVALTYSQFFPAIWGFDAGTRPRVSRPIAAITALCCAGVIATIVLVISRERLSDDNPSSWAWIDVINAIGCVKLIVTFVKYIPQAWLNYKRKSTYGWSIAQILFDVLGGVLSMLQLGIDASVQHSWKDVIDNPVKLGLSYISVFFDLIFITQHFLLYPHKEVEKSKVEDEDSYQPLLGDRL